MCFCACVFLQRWFACVSSSLGWVSSAHLQGPWLVRWTLSALHFAFSSTAHQEGHWLLWNKQTHMHTDTHKSTKQHIKWTSRRNTCNHNTHGVNIHTYLLSFPGYICVYSTLNFLAKSMNAFIGRLHFVGGTLPAVLECWLLVGFWRGELEGPGEGESVGIKKSGDSQGYFKKCIFNLAKVFFK